MKIYQNPFRFDEHCVPKNTYFFIKKNHRFLAKMPKYCPNFDFVFREIAKILPKFRFSVSRNFAKFEQNFAKHEIEYFAKCSRNYENEIFLQLPQLKHHVKLKEKTQKYKCLQNSNMACFQVLQSRYAGGAEIIWDLEPEPETK